MHASIRRAARGPVVLPVGFLIAFAPLLVPLSARGATDLDVGGEAVIADANGDPVRLREAPGVDADVITQFPEGTVLDVLDGPEEADDGSFWYRVSDGDDTGYMIADYLAHAGSTGAGTSTTTTDWLNLRAGPRTDQRVRLVIPPGETVTVVGGPRRGFYEVVYDGRPGWAHGDYLAFAGDGGGDDGGGVTAMVIDGALNLRGGPSTADDVLLVLPDSAAVTLLGGSANGFLEVSYRGTTGWAYGTYLDTGGGGGDDGGPAPAIGEAGVTSALNLRGGPSTADDVLAVMRGGAMVEITGDPENGFYPVRYDGVNGWAFGDYLDFDGTSDVSGAADVGSSPVVWPVSGGVWKITQGYNGSSHVNGSSTWQYHYSFDIVRTDSATAGQPVYSPVDGKVRWTERGSGGISIDMENGYAAAIFHITVDGGLSWGDPVAQGQYIGYISGPGGDGNMGFDHLHFSLWASDDGGNWSRVAVPFTGANAIAGVEYGDTGGFSQWAGTVFYP
jgi:uncharacterized protein YraI